MIRLIVFRDAICPSESRLTAEVPWLGPCVVDDFVPPWARTDGVVVRHQGGVVDPGEWRDCDVRDGDEITISMLPAGIGVAILSALSVAATTTTAAGVTVYTTATVIAGAVLETVIFGSISMLLTNLVDTPRGPDFAGSNTYGRGGVRTGTGQGLPIPVIYGRMKTGGVLLMASTGHVAGSVQSSGKTAIVSAGAGRTNVVIGLCEGPINKAAGINGSIRQAWFGNVGDHQVLLPNLNQTFALGLGLRDASARTQIAFHFFAPNTVQISTVRMSMQQIGSVAAGSKLSVNFKRSLPDGVDLLANDVDVDISLVPKGAYGRVDFDLPDKLSLPANTGGQAYHVIVKGDYAISATNYVSLAGASPRGVLGNTHQYDGMSWSATSPQLVSIADVISAPLKWSGSNQDLLVNGVPFDSFAAEGYLSVADGRRDQEPFPATAGELAENQVGITMDPEIGGTFESSTSNGAEGIGFVFTFPQGWYATTRSRQLPLTFDVELRWRVKGTKNWVGYHRYTYAFMQQSTWQTTVRIDFPSDTNSPLFQFRGVKLDCQVELHVPGRGVFPTKVEWRSIKEFSSDQAQGYPHIAAVQLNLDAGSQQEVVQKVEVDVEGKIVWVPDGGGTTWTPLYTTNPAEACLDWILHPRYGGGNRYTLDNIDIESFEAWRDYCDEIVQTLDGSGARSKRWEIGLVIDEERPFWDWATTIAAAGRAKLIWVGNKVRAKIEQAESVSQLFTDGNIIEGTFRQEYLSTATRPNKIQIKYFDEDLDFEETLVEHEDEAALQAGEESRVETVTMLGVTTHSRAKRMAVYMLNVARKVTTAVEFEAFIDAVAVEPGDVIAVQHSLPAWELIGGRVAEDAASATVKLDKALVIDSSGDEYKIRVRTTEDGTESFQSVTITDGTGTYPAGTAINVTPTWNPKPRKHDIYSAGPVRSTLETEIREYRVVSIELTRELTKKIKAVFYDPSVYDDDPLDDVRPPYQNALSRPETPITRGTIPPKASNLVVAPTYEPLYGGAGSTVVEASWSKTNWIYPYKTAIWVRIDTIGQNVFSKVAEVQGITYNFRDVIEGWVYTVAVTPMSPDGSQTYGPTSKEAQQATIQVPRRGWVLNAVTGFSG